MSGGSSSARGAHAAGVLFAAFAPLAYLVAMRPPGARFVPYFALHLALTALQLLAWRLARGRAGTTVPALVVAGCVARLALIATPSFTTTDVGRYLWDGAVALHGHDPYRIAPSDPSLASLARVFPQSADHHDVVTCYPPLAVALFALCAATGAHAAPVAWKLLVALVGCAGVVHAFRTLRGTPREADVVLLALSPSLVLEGGVGGHLDAMAAVCVLVCVLAAERGRWTTAALWLGVGGALKLVPLGLVLPLLFVAPQRVRFGLLAALPVAVTVAIALAMGVVPLGSLGDMAALWYFSSPLWTVLYALLPDEKPVIRVVLALLGAVLLAEIALRRQRPAHAARDGYGAMLLATPVLHPWYAAPLAATSALAPGAWALAVPAVLPLSYEVIDGYQRGDGWHPAVWPTVAIALVTLAASGFDLRRATRR